jgi:NADPH:quinone reductase
MATRTATKPRKPTIPTSMRAAAIDRFGPPAVLTLHTLPVPQPGRNEVVIAVHTAGVGIWDASIRDGSWRPQGRRTKFPLVLGTDGAGNVVARGAGVTRLKVGDRAYGYDYANPKGGFYAEFVAVSEQHAARVPKQLDLRQAGAAVTTGLTALQGIDDALHVRRGETVLVFGASGAVGTLAVQFAKRHEAWVLGTASGRDAAALVRRMGASAVIDARSKDAEAQLRKLAPDGLDAVLALAGGVALERFLNHVRPGGRVAYPNGIEPPPRHRPKIRLTAYDAEVGPREFAKLDLAVNQANLRVPIAAAYPLAQAAKAHARLEKGHILGRIVLWLRGAN